MSNLRTLLEDPSTSLDGGSNQLSITDVMRTATDRVYMKVNKLFDIQINKTDEGIVIDVFSCNPEDNADECIASTYAFDQEVMTEEEYDAAHPAI